MLTKIQSNNTNFGQLNLIKIPKSSFKNPDNLNKCAMEFDKQMSKIQGEKFSSTTIGFYIDQILYTYFGKKAKTCFHLEGTHGVNLLHRPLEKDYHSFIYTTHEENDIFLKLLSKENINSKIRQVVNWEDYKRYKHEIYGNNTNYMNLIDKILCLRAYSFKKTLDIIAQDSHKAFAGTRIHEFRVGSIKELAGIKDLLGL